MEGCEPKLLINKNNKTTNKNMKTNVLQKTLFGYNKSLDNVILEGEKHYQLKTAKVFIKKDKK